MSFGGLFLLAASRSIDREQKTPWTYPLCIKWPIIFIEQTISIFIQFGQAHLFPKIRFYPINPDPPIRLKNAAHDKQIFV